MNSKWADNEIIKSLESIRFYVEEAGVVLGDPYINELKIRNSLLIDALDLINRQKAEIESLKNSLLEEMHNKTDMGKRAVSLIDGHIEADDVKTKKYMPNDYNFEIGV